MPHTFSNFFAPSTATGVDAIRRASLRLEWNSEPLGQLPGEGSQRGVEILVVDDDVFRNLQLYRGEIPDGLDAALDHLIGDRLRHIRRGGNDSQVNAHALRQVGQLLQG